MTMLDPFMSLSLGWFLMAVGIISALTIATDKTPHTADVSPQTGRLSSHNENLKPVIRWSLLAASILLASFGALLIQENHNWLAFQRPHIYTSDINATHLRNVPDGLSHMDRLGFRSVNRT
jgi:hypothetical protein